MEDSKRIAITKFIVNALIEQDLILNKLESLGVEFPSLCSEKITNSTVLREVIELLWDLSGDGSYEAIEYLIDHPEDEGNFITLANWNRDIL
jgi:hypothetical protein